MKTYLCLGIQRGGTSLTANLMHVAGVDMLGTSKLKKKKENPKGYYENLNFVYLNDNILRKSGGSLQYPPEKLELPQKFRKRIKKIIRRLISLDGRKKWGIKDPRMVFTFPMYEGLLENIHIVKVKRNKASVVNSIYNTRPHYFKSEHQTKKYIAKYYNETFSRIDEIASRFPHISVRYEKLLTGEKELVKLAKFLEFKDIDRLKTAVAPKLKHY